MPAELTTSRKVNIVDAAGGRTLSNFGNPVTLHSDSPLQAAADLQRQTDWVKEAYSKLSADPAVRERQLAHIAAVVERMAGKGRTLLDANGRPIASAQYLAALQATALRNQAQTNSAIAKQNEFEKAWAATDITSKASTDALKAQFPRYSKGVDEAIVSAYLNYIAGDEETLPPSPDVAQATLAAQVSQKRADFNRAFKEYTGQEATGDMATDYAFVQSLSEQVAESDGFEGPAPAIRPAQEQATASAEFNRFRNEVVAAYNAPDVVDDEGFSTKRKRAPTHERHVGVPEIAVCGRPGQDRLSRQCDPSIGC